MIIRGNFSGDPCCALQRFSSVHPGSWEAILINWTATTLLTLSRTNIFVTQDDRNARLKAARTRYGFFSMIVIPGFEVQLSKAVDHLIQSLPTLFLRSFQKKPDHSISKKSTVVINAGRTADIFINPVAVLCCFIGQEWMPETVRNFLGSVKLVRHR